MQCSKLAESMWKMTVFVAPKLHAMSKSLPGWQLPRAGGALDIEILLDCMECSVSVYSVQYTLYCTLVQCTVYNIQCIVP